MQSGKVYKSRHEWVELPEALVLDLDVSAEAVRLYGLLRWSIEYGDPPYIERAQQELNANDAEVRRWVGELARRSWIHIEDGEQGGVIHIFEDQYQCHMFKEERGIE